MRRFKKVALITLCIVLISFGMYMTVLGSDTQINLKSVTSACTPGDAFEAADLAATLTGDKLNLAFSFHLSDAYLSTTAESFLDSLTVDPTDQAAVDAACAAATDAQLPPISLSFACVLDKDTIAIPAGLIGTSNIVSESGVQIGTYTVTQGSGADSNKLFVQCTLSKIVYANRTDVSARANLELDVNANGGTDPTLTLEEAEGQIAVHVTFVTSGGGDDTQNVDYTLTKAAGTRESDDPGINYTITASAAPAANAPTGTAARVNGLTIRDAIPSGLVLTGVGYNGDMLTAGVDYTFNDGVLEYKLPSYDGTNSLSSASITVYTDLSGDKYSQFLNSTSAVNWNFVNSATLYKTSPSSPLATSNDAAAAFSGIFMQKKGEQVGINGGRYKWTIEANTYFTDSGHVYLVDTIDNIDTIHMYEADTSGNIHFTVNGSERTASKVTAAGATYANLTVSSLGTLTGSGASPVYFTYDTNNNGTDDKAVLIVPLAKTDLGAPLTVVYYTQLSNLLSSLTSSDSKTLNNVAKLLWDQVTYTPGGGSGSGVPGSGGSGTVVQDYSYQLTKTVQAVYSLLQKAGGNYNTSNREMTWNLTVNRSGQDLNNVVITEELDDGIQTFKSLSAQVQTSSGTTAVTVPEYTEGASAPYYTVTKDAVSHKTTVQINLGSIAASEIYTVAFKTTVVDPRILSQQSGSVAQKLYNTAKIEAKIGDVDYSKSVTANKTLSNTLLVKDSTGSYNYTNHTVQWKITANQNHVPISDAVLTDYLPEGTTFGTISSVTRTDIDGNTTNGTVNVTNGAGTITFTDGLTITVATISGTDAVSGYSKDTVTFTYSNKTQDRFIYTFSTIVDTEYRDAVFTDLLSHNLVNDSKLTGKIQDPSGAGGADTPISVSDNATNTVTLPPVTKTGVYFDNTNYGSLGKVDYIKWTIILNKDAIDMSGVEVVDDLPAFLELVPESLSIKAATVSSSGTATPTGSNITDGLTASYSGFHFVIPAAYSRTTLVITFDTMVVDTANASQMQNTVKVKWANGSTTNGQSGQASGAVSFNADNFGTITTAPLLQVSKTSINTAYDSSGNPLYKLGGAEFTLTPMKKDASGNWVVDSGALSKTRVTSSSNGLANFFFLKRDVLYRLTETASPSGYALNNTAYYVVFKSSSNTETAYPEGTNLITGASTKLVIEDTPENAHIGYSLSFVKKTDTGVPISGVSFRLSDNSSRLEAKTAVSNEQGVVTFTNLDPGTYTLTETTPSGFQPSSTATVTVTYANGVYSVQMSGTDVTVAEDGSYTVTNRYIHGTVGLNKTDSFSHQPVSGAEFSIYSADSDKLVAFLRESQSMSGSYTLSDVSVTGVNALADPALNGYGDPLLSLQNGVLTLQAGSYYLEETKTPDGYFADKDSNGILVKHPFTITADGQAVLLESRPESGVFENTPYGTITGMKVTNSNEPLSGAVIGLFPAGTTEFTTENLFENRTATSGTDGAYTFSMVPYGTYVVAELHSPDGFYLNSSTSYTVTVNQNTAPVTTDTSDSALTIVNTRIVGTLTITKTSADGVLAGFVFTVSNASGYSQDFTTDETGTITIPDLPVGPYSVTEKGTSMTDGHYVLPETQTVDLTDDGATLSFYNDLVVATLTINKTSADGVLAGFVFTVSNGKGFSQDFTTDATGTITVSGLPIGNYTVTEKETSITKGHYVLPESQTVNLTASGASISFYNKLVVSTLTITKTSEDGSLAGFVFNVSNGAGYSKDFTTDSSGKIVISDLPVGTYTVTEKETALTKGHYVLPDGQSVVLTEAGASLSFYNKLVKSATYTGDDTSVLAWAGLLILSLAGIVGSGVIIVRTGRTCKHGGKPYEDQRRNH